MNPSFFVGRKSELEELRRTYRMNVPILGVIKGRRRIGKSRLVQEFVLLNHIVRFFNFSALPPSESITAQLQRDHFSKQISEMFDVPFTEYLDWTDAFLALRRHIREGDVILFDEISWMGSEDHTFIPKLKFWWDMQKFSIMLLLCGSVSTWIEEHIVKSTGFFGRINLKLTLSPLTIPECVEFFQKKGLKGSSYEFFILLSILGGVPWYLSHLDPSLTADGNIKKLFFEKNSLLIEEFDRIFHDLFNGKGSVYKKILETLSNGAKTIKEIQNETQVSQISQLNKMMENLKVAGFVEKNISWAFKTKKPLKQNLYWISDLFIRFYLKMVEPLLPQILKGTINDFSLSSLKGIETHLGLQMEYLLLQNFKLLWKSLGIHGIDVINDGPYRQTKTASQKGCQIDYLIQTATKAIFVCEFKFKTAEVGIDVIDEVEKKIEALKVPRGFATVPVLFHMSGVSKSLGVSSYFYRMIDINQFLK